MSAYTLAPSPADVDQLARHHFPLVVHVAKRFLRSGVPLDDLIGEGSIGLVRGLQTYDPTRGPIGAYLAIAIEHAILNGLRKWKPWHPLPTDVEGVELPVEDQAGEAPDVTVEEDDQRAMVGRLLHVLMPRERRAVELYYLREHTLVEVAAELGVTKERGRQVIFAALARLRRHARQAKASDSVSVGA